MRSYFRKRYQCNRQPGSQQQGLTLMELMIAVAITAILMKLAVPSFRDVIRNNKVQTAANSLAAAASLARVEAIRRGTYVSICPTTTNTSCYNSSTGWGGGWMVFVDTSGAADDTTAPVVGTVLLAGTKQADITTSEINSKAFMRYTSRGMVTGARAFTVKPSTCSTNFKFYDVGITPAGRPSVSPNKC